jgi:protein TonB
MKKRLILFLLALAGAVAPVFADGGREPPVPVRMIKPEYPYTMKSQGIAGVVLVKCLIDEKGNVVETQVVKSSNLDFEKPAMDALKKWKFKPAQQDGNPVPMPVSIPVKFMVES